jgi:hypothetical protein
MVHQDLMWIPVLKIPRTPCWTLWPNRMMQPVASVIGCPDEKIAVCLAAAVQLRAILCAMDQSPIA